MIAVSEAIDSGDGGNASPSQGLQCEDEQPNSNYDSAIFDIRLDGNGVTTDYAIVVVK